MKHLWLTGSGRSGKHPNFQHRACQIPLFQVLVERTEKKKKISAVKLLYCHKSSQREFQQFYRTAALTAFFYFITRDVEVTKYIYSSSILGTLLRYFSSFKPFYFSFYCYFHSFLRVFHFPLLFFVNRSESVKIPPKWRYKVFMRQ